MLAVIGLIVVVAAVLGGFSMGGGKIPTLFHPSEIIVIVGTSLGTVLVSTPLGTIKSLLGELVSLLKPTPFNRTLYLNTLKLLFELYQTAQREGLVEIESHIENPKESKLFGKYPDVLRNHHAVTFLCDSLRLILLGGVSAHDLDIMMDTDMEAHHEQSSMTVKVLQRVSDGLPGIGIVAAVLGIVITMGSINGPIESIGKHVAAALTGTFLGVLLAYGFVGPLGNALENEKAAEARYYAFLKASIVAVAKGFSPIISVEVARRSVSDEVRPSFAELEEACQNIKKQASQPSETAMAA